MDFIKRLFLGLCLATLCWAATDPKAALVVEARGSISATLNGKASNLRTLQVVAESSKVTVPAKTRLRLVYLQSGRKETITGPVSFVLSANGATQVSGSGKVEVTKSEGANTLVPRDENLRRMGGAVHAKAEKSPLELLEEVAMVSSPAAPSASGAGKMPSMRPPQAAVVRTSRPLIRNVSPVFRWVRSIQKVSWTQGKPPFAVTLTRDDGIIELALPNTTARELIFPELARGHDYVLEVKDDSGAVGREEFYILSSEEDRELREDKRALLSGLSARRDSLVAEIAFFEARGLLLEALPLAEEAVKRTPEDPGVRAALGRLQLQLGLDEEAEKTLDKAVKLDAPRPQP